MQKAKETVTKHDIPNYTVGWSSETERTGEKIEIPIDYMAERLLEQPAEKAWETFQMLDNLLKDCYAWRIHSYSIRIMLKSRLGQKKTQQDGSTNPIELFDVQFKSVFGVGLGYSF